MLLDKHNTTDQIVNGQLLCTVIVRVADATVTSERRLAKCKLNILNRINLGMCGCKIMERNVEDL
jgi:hypothetical protein